MSETEFQPIKGIQPKAWKMLIYGYPGCGKSTLATHAPAPLFLDLEAGLSRVDCEKTPNQLKSIDEILEWLRWFLRSNYKTVVIDTIDELEKHLAAKVIAEYNRENRPVKTIADIPYGRGGELLVSAWREFLQILDHVHNAGKNVLMIGHEQVIKFENPVDANFDFYTVNIHKKAAPIVTAKLDAVLFARYETVVKGLKDGKGKAVTTGERILYTSQGGSWIAKNRFGLPETMPMDKSLFDKII